MDQFDELIKIRENYVKSARENKFEEGIRSLLSELYPDNAHFVYELLQNAEDAGASLVEFELSEGSLKVTHDGSRLFSLVDIEGITGIGGSTKKDDETKIGKFGVGFKAVFAYTQRPQIYSGSYAFAITDLFVPERIAGAAEEGKTTFIFPFDREDKLSHQACAEVEKRLKELDESTLLFLENIKEITYTLPDGNIGLIERRDLGDNQIRIRSSHEDHLVDSYWFRLVGKSRLRGEYSKPLSVAAAFKLSHKDSKQQSFYSSERQGISEKFSITPVENASVSIFFPAVKETSLLKFHIHAPFASTVARDSVRDSLENHQLIEDIASLITESLPEIRDLGLLDESFLEALPNWSDPLGSMYRPIWERIRGAFNTLAITPVRGGGHYAPARELVDSPGEFRRLLSERDLTMFFQLLGVSQNAPLQWIRELSGRANRFLSDLDTVEFGWDQLGQSLRSVLFNHPLSQGEGYEANATEIRPKEIFEEWVESLSDKKLRSFYELLGEGNRQEKVVSTSQYSPIKKRIRVLDVDLSLLKIIRVNSSEAANYKTVDSFGAYLPDKPGENKEMFVKDTLATLRKIHFNDEADKNAYERQLPLIKIFFSAAGVKQWDKEEAARKKLDDYNQGRIEIPTTEDALAKHVDDIKSFIAVARGYISRENNFQDKLLATPFLLSNDIEGNLLWKSPTSIYLDAPFRETGFAELYQEKPNTKYPLSGIYLSMFDKIDDFIDFLLKYGVQGEIEIVPTWVKNNRHFNNRWVKNESHRGTAIDWDIKYLNLMLEARSARFNKKLWEFLCDVDKGKAFASYRSNGSQPLNQFPSVLIQKLDTTAWVLDSEGELKLPSEVSLDMVHESWPKPAPHSIILILNFGKQEQKEARNNKVFSYLAKEKGYDGLLKVADQFVAAGGTIEEAEQTLSEILQGRVDAAGSASSNPERRSSLREQQAYDAPSKETEVRSRSVSVNKGSVTKEAKEYLRQMYTNDDGDMLCQLCQKKLPFKHQGYWYFEAVDFIPGTERLHKHNKLALCPLCAALFQLKLETSPDDLSQALSEMSIKANQRKVYVSICVNERSTELLFTGSHAIDIQAAIRSEQAESADSGEAEAKLVVDPVAMLQRAIQKSRDSTY